MNRQKFRNEIPSQLNWQVGGNETVNLRFSPFHVCNISIKKKEKKKVRRKEKWSSEYGALPIAMTPNIKWQNYVPWTMTKIMAKSETRTVETPQIMWWCGRRRTAARRRNLSIEADYLGEFSLHIMTNAAANNFRPNRQPKSFLLRRHVKWRNENVMEINGQLNKHKKRHRMIFTPNTERLGSKQYLNDFMRPFITDRRSYLTYYLHVNSSDSECFTSWL